MNVFVPHTGDLCKKLAVHPGIRPDDLDAPRHVNFALRHVSAGMAAFLCWLFYAASAAQIGLLGWIAGLWLLSPVAVACLPRLTGSLRISYAVSMVNLTGLVTYLAVITGGSSSILLIWLVIVPLEAALEGGRRTIGTALLLCTLALLCVLGLEAAGLADTALPDAAIASLQLSAVFLVLAGAAGVFLTLPHSDVQLLADELRKQARHHLLADHALDMISLIGPDGRAHFVSSASAHVLGFEPRELEGKLRYDLIHPEDRSRIRTKFSRGVSLGENSVHQYRFRRKDGSYAWIESRTRAVPIESRKNWRRRSHPFTYYLISVARDISERKRHEAALVAARDEASQSDQAKSRFLASMSHELRTPLNAIMGFSEAMESRLFGDLGDERYVEYVRHIHDCGKHLRDLIDELLDLSRIEAGKYRLDCGPLYVPAVMDCVSGTVSIAAEKAGVRLQVKVQPDLPPLIADRRAVKQMLLNLLSNAVKFTPRGGEVTLSAWVSGTAMIMEVRDTGIGIPAAELDGLGEPFQDAPSVRRQRELRRDEFGPEQASSGLGLALVKSLAQLHGGTLAIASDPGKGTRVRIHLPVNQIDGAECAEASTGAATTGSEPGESPTALSS